MVSAEVGLSKLTLMSWNVENLFLLPDKLSPHSSGHNFHPDFGQWIKPDNKVKAIAHTIESSNADIVFLQEVGGPEVLETFCLGALKDRYYPLHLSGNSERGIEVAYLIKKNLALDFELTSHAQHQLDLSHITHPNIYYRPLFERNVLELKLNIANKNIFLFGVHLKSGQDTTGKDPGGRLKRVAEVKGLTQIVKKRLSEQEGEYILLGDFNGIAMPEAPAPEFSELYQLPGIQELLATLKVPRAKRATFLHSVQRELQLDYIFFSSTLAPFIDPNHSGIIYVRDVGGGPFRWPASTAFKQGLPSDHLPVLCTLIFNPQPL